MSVNIVEKLQKMVELHQRKADEYARIINVIRDLEAPERHLKAVRKMNGVARRVAKAKRPKPANRKYKSAGTAAVIREVALGLEQPFTFNQLAEAVIPKLKTSSKNPKTLVSVYWQKIRKGFDRTGKPSHYAYTAKEAR